MILANVKKAWPIAGVCRCSCRALHCSRKSIRL